MTARRYDPFTQALHWATVLAVVAAYAIGIYREDLPKNDFRAWLMALHMSVGLLVIGLAFIRLGWRSVVPAPTSNLSSDRMRLAAKLGHVALYATLLAIPLIGIAAGWAKGRDISFFGLFSLPAPFAPQKNWVKPLENLHEIAAHLMMLLAAAHAGVALLHQALLKDGTMARMLPFGKAPAAFGDKA